MIGGLESGDFRITALDLEEKKSPFDNPDLECGSGLKAEALEVSLLDPPKIGLFLDFFFEHLDIGLGDIPDDDDSVLSRRKDDPEPIPFGFKGI